MAEAANLLLVDLGGAAAALPLDQVLEVLRPGTITPVPGAPRCVRGVLSVRGELLPVLDLLALWGEASATGPEPLGVGRGAVVLIGSEQGPRAGIAVRSVIRLASERPAGVRAADVREILARAMADVRAAGLADLPLSPHPDAVALEEEEA